MADHGLPLQFLNLGGEMMYIIDQRLRAQEVPSDRAAKVRNDILGIMLNRRFVEEVFKPQPLYSRVALRSVFEKLAHGSIMRLNGASMDKLFELMLMALKQQVVQCRHPHELLLCTLNHLDALREYATSAPVAALLDQTLVLFLKTYLDMSEGALFEVRCLLLTFVQDLSTRVSLFLREGIQTPQGRFVLNTEGPVPCGTEIPGLLRHFDFSGDLSHTTYFPNEGNYKPPEPQGSLEPTPRPRGTNLGINLYALRDGVCSDSGAGSLQGKQEDEEPPYLSEEGSSVELSLLAQLLQPNPAPAQRTFKLNLFPDEDDSDTWDEGGNTGNVVLLETTGTAVPELQQLMKDFTVEDRQDDKDMDLLELLDSTQ